MGSSPIEALLNAAPDYIRTLPRYVPGKSAGSVRRDHGVSQVVKLDSNENPLGSSAAVGVVLGRLAAAGVAVYPDPYAFELREALSQRFGIEPGQIVLGNGSSELLDMVARAFLRDGDEAVYAQYSFAGYPLAIHMAGATGVQVPAREYGHDLPAMLAAITPRTRLVYLANPNNPTGTRLPDSEIEDFLARVPAHVAVVLDEAYTEYLADTDDKAAFGWVRRFPNLMVIRTFSKAYGLAGLRVGYAVADPAVAELVNRVRPVFNVSAMAQAAAIAALGDSEFLARSRAVNQAGMARLREACQELGLAVLPSYCNFLAVDFAGSAKSAEDVNAGLLARGLVVRPLRAYGLGSFLRITIGLPEQMDLLLQALREILAPAVLAQPAAQEANHA